jgi:eukaryotic-like serine/threonine-protein kinase
MLEAIGHYRIRREIGQGAMGVVYEGWDNHLERSVAIKAIKANESKEARHRLWREARSLARGNHPHVCQVYDVLEEGEVLVVIMELLDGHSLADRLLTGMITSSEALGFVRQMLQALQALRDLGIVSGPQTFECVLDPPRRQTAGFRLACFTAEGPSFSKAATRRRWCYKSPVRNF